MTLDAYSRFNNRLKRDLNILFILLSRIAQIFNSLVEGDLNRVKEIIAVMAEQLIPLLEKYRYTFWSDGLRQILITSYSHHYFSHKPEIKISARTIQNSYQIVDVTHHAPWPEILGNESLIIVKPTGWSLKKNAVKKLLIWRYRADVNVVSADDQIGKVWRTKPLTTNADFQFIEGVWLLSRSVYEKIRNINISPWKGLATQIETGQVCQAHLPIPIAMAPKGWQPSLDPYFSMESVSAPGISNKPLVSVMIPTAGFAKPINGKSEILVRRCLRTLLSTCNYRNLEIVVIDGGEMSSQLIDDLRQIVVDQLGSNRWKFLRDKAPYSYSHRMNLAARKSTGEYLLQLNDDTEILTPKGIDLMLDICNQPNVGVVGALLLYPDGRVQHAGVTIDNLAPNHAWTKCWPENLPWGTSQIPRQFQAVTAAVSLCKRNLWEQLDGLSEEMPINFGDVDFCLRARQLGMQVVLQPLSRWTHFESASRQLDLVPPEQQLFRERWSDILGGPLAVDPFVSAWRILRSSSKCSVK
jgi:GT2 family glycosyltransferase